MAVREIVERNDPVVTVKLRKGLAERNRLPLGHFLTVLEEFRQMVATAGKVIQTQQGVLFASGDFGLEIVATDMGDAVQPGSVWSSLAITNHAETGVLAVQEVIRTLNQLEAEDGVPAHGQAFNPDLIRRVTRVAKIQKADRLELELSVKRPGHPDPAIATFGSAGISSIDAMRTPTFHVEGLSLYGKLVELIDRDPSETGGKGFWGELRRDTGENWRIQFKQSDVDLVTPLFRKQVLVTGIGVYYRSATPKMIATGISADRERDYEAAFDEVYGCYRGTIDPDALRRLREEE